MPMYDKTKMLLEAAARDRAFLTRRDLGATMAGAVAGTAAASLGCMAGDDELGAFGGVADIPPGVHEQQMWAGRVSGSDPVANRPLLRLNLPLLYARDWTVQMAAPSIAQPNVNNLAVPSTALSTVTLRWGHHGASEEVQMTWPSRGGSVTVHGSFLELLVSDPGGGAPPALNANYAAWLSEGSAARSNFFSFQPTRTVFAGTIAIAGNALVTVPPRAKAFYMTMVTAAGPILPLEIGLLDNIATRIQFEVEASNAAAAQPRLATILQSPIPIPPTVNIVNVRNTTGDVVTDVEVHFLLDIGS